MPPRRSSAANRWPSKPPAADDTQIDSVVRRGQKLENEHRWGEAVTLYEEALRENPADHNLATRHELAKIHYDLGRRYHDSSFLRSLGSLDQRETLALYGEVLSKIQSHYVVEPDWAALVRRGTAGLEVALGETAFARQVGLTAGRPEIDAFRQQLVQQMQSQPIRNRQQAIDAVTQAAQLARQQLHLPPTAVILEYACGAAGSLDEYSAYLTSDQLNDVYSQIEGNFVGLGIELKAQDNTLLIVKVITGSPAERAGLKANDRIIAVGDRIDHRSVHRSGRRFAARGRRERGRIDAFKPPARQLANWPFAASTSRSPASTTSKSSTAKRASAT